MRSFTEVKSQPFPHPSPTAVARCRPEAVALPAGTVALAAGTVALAAATEALAAGVARVAVEEVAALMVEVARVEAVLTAAAAEVAVAEVVRTEEAEARAEAALVGAAVLQAEAGAAAIAKSRQSLVSSISGGWSPGSHNLIGAVSCIRAMATPPARTAPVIYQAGASGLPVRSVRALMANCVEPPKTHVERA